MPVSSARSTRAEVAIDIATEAGRIAKHWFDNAHYRVDEKADGSPVTQADLEVETYMRDTLTAHFPDDTVLGEEFGTTEGSTGYRWILDPIDGTKSFVRSVPLYANLIALEKDSEVVFGAINLPSAGVLVHAERGGGCWRNGLPSRVSTHDRLDGAHVMATWLEDWLPATIGELTSQGVVLRTWGDAYGYAMVASGHADAVVDYTARAYDLAPMPVIIEEAGGRFTSLGGDRSFERGSGVASNGVLHESVLKLVSQAT
jgi:histidinol phosphatase-like enzyme (inositol monophosphatase family)